MYRILALLVLALSACDVAVLPSAAPVRPAPSSAGTAAATTPGSMSFADVVAAVEPVAERECLRRTVRVNCDFMIRVDTSRGAPPNAFQSIDESGRPVITFTVALIQDVRNVDELAFVLGHEASHHIAGHLERQHRNAMAGAVIFGGLASLTGGTAAEVADAQELGAVVGARSYSKEFELEADELGTIITYRAGFQPLVGAQFFTRIPDPGNRFLGTHPPNAARLQVVAQTMRALGA